MLLFKLHPRWSHATQTAAITVLGCLVSVLSWLAMPFAQYMTFEIW